MTPQRRSQGQIVVARALWYVKPGLAELRSERLPPLRPGEVRVATQYSALSRGTERLVALGEVPESEWQTMRAPMQVGAFPFPVKYGYAAAGRVAAGPEERLGTRVFALHPHQDYFHAPETAVVSIPDAIPSARATLAANMETALNAHWDAGSAQGDTIAVVGAGIIGVLIAYLAARLPGTRVAISDVDPARESLAKALGLTFVDPARLPRDNRIVFHTSSSSAGLQSAIDACAFEGSVVEMSWYGTKKVTLDLGGAFHSRRLRILGSQVGHVAPAMRATISRRARLELALALLDDPRLDALVSEEIAFDDVPQALPRIWAASSAGLPPVIRYPSFES